MPAVLKSVHAPAVLKSVHAPSVLKSVHASRVKEGACIFDTSSPKSSSHTLEKYFEIARPFSCSGIQTWFSFGRHKDEDSMLMCLSNSQDDDSMSMCLSN